MWKSCICQKKPQKSEASSSNDSNRWVDITAPNHKPHRKNGRFRVVSYNILARWKVSSPMYSHAPPECLLWENRSKAIIDNIKSFEADFICLQEVDEYETFFKRNMEAHGYSGIYIQRDDDNKRDGSAIFYKSNFAKLLDQEIIRFNDLANSQPIVNGLRTGCVGIMTAFKISKPFKHVVIIANTHLKSEECNEWGDVKLPQAKHLMFHLAMFTRRISREYKCQYPSTILAGDFNSNPASKVYRHITRHRQSLPSGRNDDETFDFKLVSAYGVTNGELGFTKYLPSLAETFDYVFFFPSGSTHPVKLLGSPEVEDFLPNKNQPSDHLPIGVEFEFQRNQ